MMMGNTIAQLVSTAISAAMMVSITTSGWDLLVKSMSGAIHDRSQVVHLGYGLAAVLFVWVNYRLAKWILRRMESPQHHG